MPGTSISTWGSLGALLTAILAMLVAYRLLPTSAGYWARRARTVTSPGEDTPTAAWVTLVQPLVRLLRPVLPANLVQSAARRCWWVGGSWFGVDGVTFYALSLALGLVVALVAGVTLGDMVGVPAGMALGGVMGFLVPTFLTAGRSKRAQREFRRGLADYVELLSLLASQGQSVPNAVTQLAGERTRVSAFFATVLAQSAGGDFYRLLLERSEEVGLDSLVFLAAELRLIHQQGRGEKELLQGLAADVRRQNKREMLQQAKALGNQLVFPLILFFFIPFLIVLMTPMFAGILGMMGLDVGF